ncbi:MAG: response regulator [Ignavibacteriae bacterium]|nr:response regulator [Ignavibacteriota bacterium]NOG96528.1 response regulator [Ignavibacteriota bacterium]
MNKKPKILIVDDEKGLRLGTKRLLESEGYYVETAENGTIGIQLGTKKDFDIAVIDLKMPDIDGTAVLKAIKEAKPNTVCFIATAYASYDSAVESTRLGAYSYIPKPFTPDEFIHEIEKGYKQRLLILEAEKLKQEREERMLELANEKSRLNTIIESITSGVLVVNSTGEIVYYNHAALNKLDIEEISLGEYILDKLPDEITESVNKYLKSDQVIYNSYTVEVELKTHRELFVDVTCSPVVHPDGSLAGVVIVIKNITEFKKIELLKSQFVSMVAHELKTPIAAVQGFLKIILDDQLNIDREKQKEYLQRSTVRLEGLLTLVNDLLDISRMEIKSKKRDIEELDVKEIFDSTLQFLEIEIKKKGIIVELNIEEEIPPLKADQNEITRLLTNILSNAIKYNKSNGTINIEVQTNNNYFLIDIADTGIGLTPEEKEKLFLEFYRAKNENTRNVSGTGLGLTIVKRIIDSYHGKITVDSTYGEGTIFKIQLPK